MRTLIAASIAALTLTNAHAFDERGYRTGMSPDQVSTEVEKSGYSLRTIGPNPNMAFAVTMTPDGKVLDQIGDTFSFCDGRLDAYGRSGPFTDYANFLELLLTKYGQPAKLAVQRQTIPGAGQVSMVRNYWYRNGGNERVLVYVALEKNVGPTPAFIGYATKSRCNADTW